MAYKTILLHLNHEPRMRALLSVGIDLATPEGQACTFYGSALAEILRLLTGFEGAMAHERCRARGDDRCFWRATAVGGYD